MSASNKTTPPWDDDAALKRFVCGVASAEEAMAFEARRESDGRVAELVLALEDEMIRDYVRSELPEEWRRPFEASLAASPVRRRRVEETRSLVESMADVNGTSRAGVRWSAGSVWLSAAASVLLAVGAAWWVGVPRRGELVQPSVRPIIEFALDSTTRRSSGPGNVLPLGPAHDSLVRLTGTFPGVALPDGDLPCRIEAVGSGPIAIESRPRFVGLEDGLVRFEWLVPQERLSSGDYLLFVGDEDDPRGVLGSWAFAIVP